MEQPTKSKRRPSTSFDPTIAEGSVSTSVDKGFTHKRTPEQGIVDTSTAEKIELFGGLATDAHKGYRTASLRTEVEAELNTFIEGKGVPTVYEDVDTGWTVDEKEALANATKDGEKVRRARLSGARNSMELNILLENITKRHINNMPGLASEFRSILSQQKGDNAGKISFIEAQERSREGAGKTREAIIKSASIDALKLFGIDTINQPLESWYPDYIYKKEVVARAARIETAVGANANFKLHAMNETPVVSEHTTGRRIVIDRNLRSILENPAAVAPNGDTKDVQINKVIDLEIKEVVGKWNVPGKKQHPLVTAHVAALERKRALYTKHATGVYDLEQIRRSNETSEAMILAEIMDDPQLARVVVASKLLGGTLENMGLKREASRQLLLRLKKIGEGDKMLKPPGQRTEQDEETVANVFTHLGKWMEATVEGGLEEGQDPSLDSEYIVDTIVSMTDKWHAGEEAPTFDKLLALSANPSMATFLKKYDTEGKAALGLENVLGAYIHEGVTGRFDKLFKPETMKLTVNAEGNLVASPLSNNDPDTLAETRNINRKYLTRFNQWSRGIAHASHNVDYAGYAKGFANTLNARSDMGAANRDENGDPIVTRGTEVTPENANWFVKRLDMFKSKDTGKGTESEGTLEQGAEVIFAPGFYELVYGTRDIDNYQVMADHLGQIWNSTPLGAIRATHDWMRSQMMKVPKLWDFFNQRAKRDKNGNRVYFSGAEAVETPTGTIGPNDISNDASTVPSGPSKNVNWADM